MQTLVELINAKVLAPILNTTNQSFFPNNSCGNSQCPVRFDVSKSWNELFYILVIGVRNINSFGGVGTPDGAAV